MSLDIEQTQDWRVAAEARAEAMRQEAGQWTPDGLLAEATRVIKDLDIEQARHISSLALYKAMIIQTEPYTQERNDRLQLCYQAANALIAEKSFALFRTDS